MKFIVLLVITFFTSSCIRKFDDCTVYIEVKPPEKSKILNNLEIHYAEHSSLGKTEVYKLQGTYTSNYLIFDNKYTAFIVTSDELPSQVLIVDGDSLHDNDTWSDWLMPSYFDKTSSASWNALDRKEDIKSPIEESMSFKFRYKIKKNTDAQYCEYEFEGKVYDMIKRKLHYGESLETISKNFKVPVHKLRILNNLQNNEILEEGDWIIAPYGYVEEK